jgi:hypothetical protein
LRLLKAILAVVFVAALLVIPGNGRNGETNGGDDSNARSFEGGTVSSTETIPAAETHTSSSTWPTWPESASVELGEELRLSCPVIVYSTPEEVWDVLTTVRRFFMWYPHWEREEDLMRRLAAVGDTVAFHRRGEVAGRSVVIWLEPLKELKIVHELEDGLWAGSILISLDPADRGVGLSYEELLPYPVTDIESERRRVCKQVMLIKRLAEGE